MRRLVEVTAKMTGRTQVASAWKICAPLAPGYDSSAASRHQRARTALGRVRDRNRRRRAGARFAARRATRCAASASAAVGAGDLLHLVSRRCNAGPGRSRRRARPEPARRTCRRAHAIERSSETKHAVEADLAADHLGDHDGGDNVARRDRDRSPCIDDMRGHRPGHVRQARGTARNRSRQLARGVSTTGSA